MLRSEELKKTLIAINELEIDCSQIINCTINRKILNEELEIDLSSCDLTLRASKELFEVLEDIDTVKILKVFKDGNIEFIGVLEGLQDYVIGDFEDIKLEAIDILKLIDVEPKETIISPFLYEKGDKEKPRKITDILKDFFNFLQENIKDFKFELGSLNFKDNHTTKCFFLPYNETLLEILRRLCFEYRLYIYYDENGFNFYSFEEALIDSNVKEFKECINTKNTRVNILKREETDLELSFTDRVYKGANQLFKENKAIFSAIRGDQDKTSPGIKPLIEGIQQNEWYPFRASTGVIWSAIGTGFLRNEIKTIGTENKLFIREERERTVNPIIAFENAFPLWNPYNECFKTNSKQEDLKKIMSKSQFAKDYPDLASKLNVYYPDEKNSPCNNSSVLNLDYFNVRLDSVAVAWYVNVSKSSVTKKIIYYDVLADVFYRKVETTFTEYKQFLEKVLNFFLYYINDYEEAKNFFYFFQAFISNPTFLLYWSVDEHVKLGEKYKVELPLRVGKRDYEMLLIAKSFELKEKRVDYKGIKPFKVEKRSIIIKEDDLELNKIVGKLSIATTFDTAFIEIFLQHNYNNRDIFDFFNKEGKEKFPLNDPILLTNNIYNIAEYLQPEDDDFYSNIYLDDLEDDKVYFIYPDAYVDGLQYDPFLRYMKDKLGAKVEFVKKFDDSYFNFIETTFEDEDDPNLLLAFSYLAEDNKIDTKNNIFGTEFLSPLQEEFILKYSPVEKP